VKRHEVRAYKALHRWRLLNPSLTREEVYAVIDSRALKAVTASAGARLCAISEWADQFIWD
jgi:hypothetical protein